MLCMSTWKNLIDVLQYWGDNRISAFFEKSGLADQIKSVTSECDEDWLSLL